jgi:molecular chaperone DnaK
VTVPAYFTDAQRSATNEAVKLAGLNLLSNVNEPTAAAIFYAHKSNMYEANTLVFDLGGGTFDVTIMHINNGEVEVKSTRGLKNVGGSFFDQQLVDYICEEFNDKHNIDLEDEEYIDVYQGLYEKVEKAKKQICKNKTQTLVPVSAGTEKDKIVITYDYFVDEIISKLCDKMENLVKMAISDAGLTVNDINQVIMVGGSSRIPYIEERITKLMGKNPLKVVNPDEVVALGAAIQADKLSKNVANNVKDVCSHGLGIIRYSPKEEKKINEVMIPRNTQVPTNVVGEACFAFAQDGQKFLKVVVTEGDYDDVTYAVTIKELQFDLPEGIKYGMKYTISMAVDEKQDIAVSIEIPEMKKKLEMSVRSQSSEGKSDNDVSPELINILKGMSVA